jgi:hypothetical protein
MPRYSADRIEEIRKIDLRAIDGLVGVSGTLGYDVNEMERHFHNTGHWFGRDAGDTFFAENSLTPWQLTAGAGDAFGNWVQLSNGDEIASPYYDPHLILVTQASATGNIYLIQFGTGAGGAQTVRTTAAHFPAATLRQSPEDVICPRIGNTELFWARAACETDGATISFIVGLHTYAG